MSELIPERKAGRPRLYMTEAQKKKAYRERRAARALADFEQWPKQRRPNKSRIRKNGLRSASQGLGIIEVRRNCVKSPDGYLALNRSKCPRNCESSASTS